MRPFALTPLTSKISCFAHPRSPRPRAGGASARRCCWHLCTLHLLSQYGGFRGRGSSIGTIDLPHATIKFRSAKNSSECASLRWSAAHRTRDFRGRVRLQYRVQRLIKFQSSSSGRSPRPKTFPLAAGDVRRIGTSFIREKRRRPRGGGENGTSAAPKTVDFEVKSVHQGIRSLVIRHSSSAAPPPLLLCSLCHF